MGALGGGTALSVLGLGLQGYSAIKGGQAQGDAAGATAEYQLAKGDTEARAVLDSAVAEAEGYRHSSRAATVAAKTGLAQAEQVGAAYRTELATTISNIRAIRASTGASVSSPTTIAYIARQEKTSEAARLIKEGGLRTQSAQDAADALFYRTAARSSLTRGKRTATSIVRTSRLAAKATLAGASAYETGGILTGLSYFAQGGAKLAGY